MYGTFVLPKIIAPAFFSLSIDKASLAAILSFKAGFPLDVTVPARS